MKKKTRMKLALGRSELLKMKLPRDAECNLLIKASHCKWEFYAAMQLRKYEEKRGFPLRCSIIMQY